MIEQVIVKLISYAVIWFTVYFILYEGRGRTSKTTQCVVWLIFAAFVLATLGVPWEGYDRYN